MIHQEITIDATGVLACGNGAKRTMLGFAEVCLLVGRNWRSVQVDVYEVQREMLTVEC